MFAGRIMGLCEKFKNRFEGIWVETVLGYIEHGENSLAFEELCYYFAEYDISLSLDEYDEMVRLAEDMEFDMENVDFKYLKALIK